MSKIQSLVEVKIGEIGIVSYILDENVACKLISMGVTPGSTLQIIRKSPFGGGYYCKVSESMNIAIRKEEAKSILIEMED
jgi:ferrous iron transport protein A